MDPLSLAVGAGILAVGMLAGYLRGRRDRRPTDPEPICGCGHHRAMHDGGGSGKCVKALGRRETFSADGRYIGLQPYHCSCQQYVGPEPISSMWTPPVLPEGSER